MSIKTDQGTWPVQGTRPVRFPSGVCEEMELVSVLPVLAPQQLERSARSAGSHEALVQ